MVTLKIVTCSIIDGKIVALWQNNFSRYCWLFFLLHNRAPILFSLPLPRTANLRMLTFPCSWSRQTGKRPPVAPEWVLQEACGKHLSPSQTATRPSLSCSLHKDMDSPECCWQVPTYHARWNLPWDKANPRNGGADRQKEPGSLRMSLICWSPSLTFMWTTFYMS